MKAITNPICLLSLLAAAACSGGSAPTPTPNQSGPVAATPEREAELPTHSLTPEQRIESVRGLLQARHPSDLPGKLVLDKHTGANDSLRWLASNDDKRIVRVRALTLLRHYPDVATRELLTSVADRADLPSAIRAAALRGMVGFDFATDTAMRDSLLARIGDRDPMIAVAAVQTLAMQPSTVALVRNAAADKSLPQVTRDAANAAVNPQ